MSGDTQTAKGSIEVWSESEELRLADMIMEHARRLDDFYIELDKREHQRRLDDGRRKTKQMERAQWDEWTKRKNSGTVVS